MEPRLEQPTVHLEKSETNDNAQTTANKLLAEAGEGKVERKPINEALPTVPRLEIIQPVIPGDRPFDGKATPSEKFAPAKVELEQAYKSRDRIRNDWTTQAQSDAAGITSKIDKALQQLKGLAKDTTPAEMHKLVDDIQKDGLFPLLAVQWAQEKMGKANQLTRKDLQDVLDKNANPKNATEALDRHMAAFFLERAQTGNRAKDALGYDNFYYFSKGQSTLRGEETRIMTREHSKNIVAGTDQAERR